MDRKKELKSLYKQMKPQMGIFIIRSKSNNKCHIEATQDIKGTMNSTKFKLSAGIHPYRELQKEWTDLGEENFISEILDTLEYSKDDSKTDYTEDLDMLKTMWKEKLTGQGLQFYNKKA